jgi:hypothetical protein
MGGSTGLAAVLLLALAHATGARRQGHLINLAYCSSTALTSGSMSAVFAVWMLLKASPIPPHAGGMRTVAILGRVGGEYNVRR